VRGSLQHEVDLARCGQRAEHGARGRDDLGDLGRLAMEGESSRVERGAIEQLVDDLLHPLRGALDELTHLTDAARRRGLWIEQGLRADLDRAQGAAQIV